LTNDVYDERFLIDDNEAASEWAFSMPVISSPFITQLFIITFFSLTDPPFELVPGGMKKGKLNYEAGEIFKTFGFNTRSIQFDRWIPEIYRVLKEKRYFYVMSNDRNLFSIHSACIHAGFKFCELLVMDKK